MQTILDNGAEKKKRGLKNVLQTLFHTYIPITEDGVDTKTQSNQE